MKSLVAALVLVAACKSHDTAGTAPPPPAVGVPGEPPPSAAMPPGSAAPSAAPSDYAAPPECDVLVKADAEALFGGPLPDPDMHPIPLGFQCDWKHRKPLGAVDLTLYTKGDAGLFDRNVAAGLLGSKPIDLPGVGERAQKSAANSALMILAHGKVAFVIVVSPASDPGPRIDAFAKSLAAKL
ncbi:MAG TPA: hypothetical protein VGM88_23115 [Kofleriaceae bacterium]|jgi:hypothetical protein